MIDVIEAQKVGERSNSSGNEEVGEKGAWKKFKWSEDELRALISGYPA